MSPSIGIKLGITGHKSSGPPAARIVLTSSIIGEDADVGDLVGALSVTNGSGTYVFTLIDDAGGLFALDGEDVEVAGALDYETATFHTIEVEADNGVDDPIMRILTILVTDVTEGGFGDESFLLLDQGGVTLIHLGMI